MSETSDLDSKYESNSKAITRRRFLGGALGVSAAAVATSVFGSSGAEAAGGAPTGTSTASSTKSPTSTETPTQTPTVNALETQVGNSNATSTAINLQETKATIDANNAEKIRNLTATSTPSVTPTPTETLTPTKSPTPNRTIEARLTAAQGALDATPPPSQTPTPTETPEPLHDPSGTDVLIDAGPLKIGRDAVGLGVDLGAAIGVIWGLTRIFGIGPDYIRAVGEARAQNRQHEGGHGGNQAQQHNEQQRTGQQQRGGQQQNRGQQTQQEQRQNQQQARETTWGEFVNWFRERGRWIRDRLFFWRRRRQTNAQNQQNVIGLPAPAQAGGPGNHVDDDVVEGEFRELGDDE